MKKISKIDYLDVFCGDLRPSYPQLDGDKIYWLQAVPERAGKSGLYVVGLTSGDQKPRLISPENCEPKSKVHEYGGRPYLANGYYVYFVNASNQQVYRLSTESGELRQITDNTQWRYVDFVMGVDEEHLFCIAEQLVHGAEHKAMIVALAIDDPVHTVEPIVLASGADFYAGLAVDQPNRQLAWFEWGHPNMPWDSSRLVISNYSTRDHVALSVSRVLVDSAAASVCQPHFTVDGALVFALDGEVAGLGSISGEGFADALPNWQLIRWKDGDFKRLTHDDAEYGTPFWVFGERRIVNFDGKLTAIGRLNGRDDIVTIDCSNLGESTQTLGNNDDFDVVEQLFVDAKGQQLLALAGSANQPLGIWRFSKSDQDTQQRGWKKIVGSEPIFGNERLDEESLSRPEHFAFPTRDGKTAYAFYYPPSDGTDDAAPTLVMVHGGPTTQATSLYDRLKQFWTMRGFTVLDINYRGSSGYGREFRQSLAGQWGLRDVDDIIDAIEFAINQGWVARNKVFVRGKSAGGYVVLRLLTEYGEYFAAGASYYGIGDLTILAEDTHKFEARYMDGLLGQSYDAQRATQRGDPYYDRSPVHALDKIQCPVIVFQGADDRVVPPSLAHNLVDTLAACGIDHEYVEYPGEGHGFRNPENSSDALERELAFYRKVL